ncbi:MAG: serine protease [Thermoanaerobaculia bacterium]|nr:serine protease [Thermoanaerobaculia bacterium]
MDQEELRQLRARASRVFGERPVEETVHRVRAIIGPPSFTDVGAGEAELTKRAEEGIEALRSEPPTIPTPAQFQALLILIQLARPVVPTADGALGRLPKFARGNEGDNGPRNQAWKTLSDKVSDHLYSIGRIDSASGRHWGTGFLATDELVMTNRHVLDQMTFGSGRLEPGQAVVNFRQEWGQTDGGDRPVPVQAVAKIHDHFDLAMLRVPPQPHRRHLVFSKEGPEPGDQVVVIGYPYPDAGNSPAMMERVFKGRYGVKQASPGEVTGVEEAEWFHDCSTLGGNSGSPVLDLSSAEVVGVHRSGGFMWRNEAIQGHEAAQFVS